MDINNKKRKKKLVELGIEELADKLIEFSASNYSVSDWIDRIIAKPSDSLKRLKAKLRGLERQYTYYNYNQTMDFAYELSDILDELKESKIEAEEGLKLITDFFKLDSKIFESCDDSGGSVGEVFQSDACEVFVFFAKRCKNMEFVNSQFMIVVSEDNYGVRSALVKYASKIFSKSKRREIVSCFLDKSLNESDEYGKFHWNFMAEDLSKSINDPKLYEMIKSKNGTNITSSVCFEIAKEYFRNKKFKSALEWMTSKNISDKFSEEENILLLDIYKKLKKHDDSAEIANLIYNNNQNKNNLIQLLDIIGYDNKEKILKDSIIKIQESKHFERNQAQFLLDMELVELSEEYFLKWESQLSKFDYYTLGGFTEALENNKSWLAATVVYRALLEINLNKVQSKYYYHGVRYLNRLNKIAEKIDNWSNIVSHEEYFQDIKKIHFRKKSFWAKYGK